MSLEGIDVSNFQGYVDWTQVRNAGKSFAFVKATEGTGFRDQTFGHNWAGLATNHMVRGAYHFFHPAQDPRAQVDNLHAHVRDNGHFQHGDMIVLDVEIAEGVAPADILARVQEFVDYATRSIAKQVVLYTYPDYWLRVLGDPKSDDLASCPLWIASYGPNVPAFANWPTGPAFWQYTDVGHCPGVSGPIDLNKFLGSWAALRQISTYTAG